MSHSWGEGSIQLRDEEQEASKAIPTLPSPLSWCSWQDVRSTQAHSECRQGGKEAPKVTQSIPQPEADVGTSGTQLAEVEQSLPWAKPLWLL